MLFSVSSIFFDLMIGKTLQPTGEKDGSPGRQNTPDGVCIDTDKLRRSFLQGFRKKFLVPGNGLEDVYPPSTDPGYGIYSTREF